MRKSCAILLVSLTAVALGACGGGGGGSKAPSSTSTTASLPRLARKPARAGEIVFAGQSSPASYGPIKLDGTYVVRFEQFAPENPKQDFTNQTPFRATLERRSGVTKGSVRLFSAARRTGRKLFKLKGKYVIDVSFGDFPFAVRMTPRK